MIAAGFNLVSVVFVKILCISINNQLQILKDLLKFFVMKCSISTHSNISKNRNGGHIKVLAFNIQITHKMD